MFGLLAVGNTVSIAQHRAKDSVVVPASNKYVVTSPLRTVFIGKNYRKEWIQPVKIAVLDLKREQGGFAIVDSGGGRQTNNLKLVDRKGNEWILRQVDKDIEKSMLAPLRNTFVETIMQDFQTGLHPYAALTVPVLAKAAGVPTSRPRLFFVPDDAFLGKHRALFANSVCVLEEREPTADHSDTKSTNTIMEKVTDETEHRLLQKFILRARLLDMLLGDWDRHEDQWRWGVRDSTGIHYYYPIPRDRDYVFFKSDGWFLRFSSIFFQPYMRGFSKRANGLKNLNWKVLSLDRRWLNELTADDWKQTITKFQRSITDSVIQKAVKEMPSEIFALSGEEIISKLKSRRNSLLKHGMRYYEFLAAHAIVEGTDEAEIFTVRSMKKGLMIQRKTPQQKIVYQRIFRPGETKKISIRGLGGNDQYNVDSNMVRGVRIWLEGGDGLDSYNLYKGTRAKIKDGLREKEGKEKKREASLVLAE